MPTLPSNGLDCSSQNLHNFSSQPSQSLQTITINSYHLSPSLSDSCTVFISNFLEPSSRITTLLPLPVTCTRMIMCHGRLGGFGFDLVSSWATGGTGMPTNMESRRMGWKKREHAKWQFHQWMNEWNMRSEQMWQKSTFTNRWACPVFKHASKEKHAKVSSSEPRTIKDSMHFTMQMWSYDTPWRHPSPSRTIVEHAHECSSIIMSSHVDSIHESCHPHPHYGIVFNQCDVTWKSKRPTFWTKSHVSQRVMEVKWSWG